MEVIELGVASEVTLDQIGFGPDGNSVPTETALA
jgi:hypothetical protein